MSTTKNKYNFYISYWESFNALSTDNEKVEFITLINKIHFFEEHIDKIKITNPNVKLLFASIKHSLKASIQGYCDKKEIEYDSLFSTPCEGGSEGAYEPPCQQLVINNKQLEIDNKKEVKRFCKPSLQELTNYCNLNAYNIDPENFLNFYDSKGWKVGSQPMKDWQACVRTWVKRNEKGGGQKSTPLKKDNLAKTDEAIKNYLEKTNDR